MSVLDRIKQSLESYVKKDYEDALLQICCTIEPTAEVEYGKGGRATYKQFIQDNMRLITKTTFGYLTILNMNFAYSHPELKPDANGLCSLQDIIYHVVRSGLYHKGALPVDLLFDDSATVSSAGNVLKLPRQLIPALVVAVITSPAYAGTTEDIVKVMNLRTLSIPLGKLWGKRKELLDLYDAVDALDLW